MIVIPGSTTKARSNPHRTYPPLVIWTTVACSRPATSQITLELKRGVKHGKPFLLPGSQDVSRQHPFPSATPTPFGPPSRCLTPCSIKIDPDRSNASVTNLILSDYGLPTPALPTSSLTPPGRLHVRNQADVSPSYFFLDSSTRDDTPTAQVPYNPISTNGSGIYDAIAYAGVYR